MLSSASVCMYLFSLVRLCEDVEEGKLGVIRIKDVCEKARCSGSALVEAERFSTRLIYVMDQVETFVLNLSQIYCSGIRTHEIKGIRLHPCAACPAVVPPPRTPLKSS